MFGLAMGCGGEMHSLTTPSPVNGASAGGDGARLQSTGQTKTDLCHRTEGAFEFTLISVADPAVDVHLAHGDAAVGGPVPGMPGMVFGPACELLPGSPSYDWVSGRLTGINGINVSDTLYDVDFVAGSALDLFYDVSTDTWDFDFRTLDEAIAASQALLDALPPEVDTTPWLMYGIEEGTNPDAPQEQAYILTPYDNVPGQSGNGSGQWLGAFAINKSDAWVLATHSDDEVTNGGGQVDTDYFPIYDHIFADWTVR